MTASAPESLSCWATVAASAGDASLLIRVANGIARPAAAAAALRAARASSNDGVSDDDERGLGEPLRLQLGDDHRRLLGVRQRRREVGLEVGEARLVDARRQVRDPVLVGVLGARRDLVGAAAADEQEGAVLLDHLPAHLHGVLRVELVVAEHDAHVAPEQPVRRGGGEELPVDVLADVEALLRDRRRAGDGGVDADDDLGVGDAGGVVRARARTGPSAGAAVVGAAVGRPAPSTPRRRRRRAGPGRRRRPGPRSSPRCAGVAGATVVGASRLASPARRRRRCRRRRPSGRTPAAASAPTARSRRDRTTGHGGSSCGAAAGEVLGDARPVEVLGGGSPSGPTTRAVT